MRHGRRDPVAEAEQAAVEALLHNAVGPYLGLPRAAGWGYPEPYTRDLMISAPGILASGNDKLIARLRRVLEVLARNRSPLGHIPSLAHDPEDRGSSDATPLFLLGLGLYRRATGEADFLAEAAEEALTWMDYQSPEDRVMVAQLPTSDWRDEQWVTGYGLYVNTIVYCYLRLFGRHRRADRLRQLMDRFTVTAEVKHRHIHEGLKLRRKPYYALYSYKVFGSERFDLLGNSLAILSGIAAPTRARALVAWVERECWALQERGELALDLPPNLFPYIQPDDPDWQGRYAKYNRPGEYHNGGVWPFVCGAYVAAIVAAGGHRLARKKLTALTELVRPARERPVAFGFNEWFRAQDGRPCGQDWQTWSAAMYLYASTCVQARRTPWFDEIRESGRPRTPNGVTSDAASVADAARPPERPAAPGGEGLHGGPG